jgi:osmoprotectant transport system ATP-binding protein
MISLANVSKSFDNTLSWALKDVSLAIQKGETLALLGSSGSGKSTLLKMINRLIQPSAGEIMVDDKNIKDYDAVELRRSFGYVFQGIGLFPHMTVAENITIVLRLTKQSRTAQQTRAYELLELVNLSPNKFAKRYPAELSGGQQQRVGVARALAADPNYLLMDEPFGALDAITRAELQQEIIKLKKELNKTILFITHDVFEAMLIGDRLGIMHQGRLEQIGNKTELINHPKTDFVRGLFQNTIKQIQQFVGNST